MPDFFECSSQPRASRFSVRAQVTLRVMDANTLRRDVLIGQYEFDLTTVYFRQHHEVYR